MIFNWSNWKSLFSTESYFVIGLARFMFVSIQETLITSAATAHRPEWYAMELCFLLRVDASCEVLLTKLWLSQRRLVGPSMVTPNIRSLKRRAEIYSKQHFIAIKSLLENVLASIGFCLLLNQIIGERLIKMMKSLWLLHVTLLTAWEASTYAFVNTGWPRGSGVRWSGGSCFFASRYWSLNTSDLSFCANHIGSILRVSLD